jgi:hypothetical protein
MKTEKRQKVKILGQTVTVGTKKHELLLWQLRRFNDLLESETKKH